MNSKMKAMFIMVCFLAAIFIYNILIANAVEVSYCCEKTVDGAWCQNAPMDKCDSDYRKVPASCEATSYCKLGTCVDSQEGICMENTPQKVCEDPNGDGDKSDGGVWIEGTSDEIPQCQLGCCVMGDQAAFVTQTRCKRLSAIYGLEINFKTNVGSEIECIATATSQEKGACVFEREFERTCKFTTRKECQEMEKTLGAGSTEFYEGVLCSAEELGTNCGPSEKTTCVEGRDEVYFVDTCGNIANIYDARKIRDKSYWSRIVSKEESCGFNDPEGNKNSATCGNCDYFLGSTCKAYERGKDRVKPNYGNFICRSLDCKYEGKKYRHGETFCIKSEGADKNLPGSRYFRGVCYNGEITIEPCADYRQEICIEDEVNGFKTAACRVNKWQDCIAQQSKKDCENKDKRDCVWIGEGVSRKAYGALGEVSVSGGVSPGQKIKCVPEFTPGLGFWDTESDAAAICSAASTQCEVVYEKGLLGGKKVKKNKECLGSGWENKMQNICSAIGDCTGYKTVIEK